MNRKYEQIPGYPGDGDSDIELHHSQPMRWTRSLTIWSIVGIVGSIALAVAIFAVLI